MMKKNLAKILVLVLIVALLAPAMASAATTYTVDVSLKGPGVAGDATEWKDTFSYQADTVTLKQLIADVLGKKDDIKAKFSTSGMDSDYADLKAAAEATESSAWEGWFESVQGVSAEQKAVLVNRDSTLAQIDAVASEHQFVVTFGSYTLTVKLTPTVVNDVINIPVTETATSTEEAAEEPVVVDGSDITEDEPVVIEEAVAVADSAEEASEIQIENIPEEVQEIALEVALEAAEDAEVSENTTVLAIKDKDGNVTIIPMAVISVDEDGNITAKGSLSKEATEALKDGGSVIAYDNEQPAFTDVTAAVKDGTITQDEADAVAYWQARGVTVGEGDGTLGGIDEEVSRARFATLLYRAFGSPEPENEADYADLTGKFAYAKDAASWAAEAGLMNGVGDDADGNALFGTGSIEAWQMALIMYRALGNNDSSDGYTDSWNWAVKNGLISGEKDVTPDMPALLLMMQNLAAYLDGAKMEGDSDLETTALDAAE